MLRMQELFFLGEGTLKHIFAQFRPPPPLNFQKVLQETISVFLDTLQYQNADDVQVKRVEQPK